MPYELPEQGDLLRAERSAQRVEVPGRLAGRVEGRGRPERGGAAGGGVGLPDGGLRVGDLDAGASQGARQPCPALVHEHEVTIGALWPQEAGVGAG